MLTPKERLKLSLKRMPVDRAPCICPGGMMNMIVEEVMDLTGCPWPEAHSNPELLAGLSAGMYQCGGFENYGVPLCMTVEAEAMGARVGMGTKINEPKVTGYPITSVTEWRKLKPLDLAQGRVKVVLEAIKILKSKSSGVVPIIGNLVGPVSLAASLMEPTVYYKELCKNNRESHELMGFVTANLIRFGRAQLQAGADVLAIADPGGTGEILGPKMFREYAVPYLNQIIEAVQDLVSVGTIIHICGRLKSIYPELNLLRSDAVSFDSISSVKQVAEKIRNKAVMGNVSTYALERGTKERVKLLAQNCLHKGAAILAPACGIGPRTSLANIRAMVETAQEFGPFGHNL